MQADSLAQSGNFPLKSDAILTRLESITKNPELGASDVVDKTITKLREKIADLTTQGGTIDARALYTVRKEIGDAIKLNAKELGNSDKRLTAGLQQQIQKQIDDAIEGAGNAGWKDYLKKYAEMSKPIDEMRVGKALNRALTSPVSGQERDVMFGNAVEAVKNKVSKDANRPLIDAVSPQNRTVIDAVMGDLKNNRQVETMAREGVEKARETIGLAVPKIPTMGMFSPTLSVTRSIVNRMEGKATNKLLDNAEQIMANPQEAARVMREATPAQRKVLEAMLQASQRTAVQGAVDQF